MKTSVKAAQLDRLRSPFLAVALGEVKGRDVPGSLRSLDRAMGGALRRSVASGDFRGKSGETALFYPGRGPRRLLLVGLGESSAVGRSEVRRGAAVAASQAVTAGLESMAFYLEPETAAGLRPEDVGQVVVEGVGQGAWQFTAYKDTGKDAKTIERLEVITQREQRSAIDKGRELGAAIALGQRAARGFQALPGNICTPRYLGDAARKMGKRYGYKVTVLGKAQIAREGMHALMAVAQGSSQDPRFIALEYRGAGQDPPLCFVGKGVTFDSGGISIKPALHMEEMKYDMSGAAAVLGLFETLGVLKPPVNVVGLVPATENMPSGTAVKPGDIVSSHLGKMIEVVNTDAEGRLILADALSYARRYKPACVIDAATLTGAVVIGLGHHATGLMGTDERLVEEIRRAGELAGERCWPLPLWDDYRPQIASDVADVKNTGGRAAGSITAGWFLREFVEGYPWAHLDIAGTAYTDTKRADLAKGPTGVGVRLFSQFVLGRAKA